MALDDPFSVILTESISEKIFGDQNNVYNVYLVCVFRFSCSLIIEKL